MTKEYEPEVWKAIQQKENKHETNEICFNLKLIIETFNHRAHFTDRVILPEKHVRIFCDLIFGNTEDVSQNTADLRPTSLSNSQRTVKGFC